MHHFSLFAEAAAALPQTVLEPLPAGSSVLIHSRCSFAFCGHRSAARLIQTPAEGNATLVLLARAACPHFDLDTNRKTLTLPVKLLVFAV